MPIGAPDCLRRKLSTRYLMAGIRKAGKPVSTMGHLLFCEAGRHPASRLSITIMRAHLDAKGRYFLGDRFGKSANRPFSGMITGAAGTGQPPAYG